MKFYSICDISERQGKSDISVLWIRGGIIMEVALCKNNSPITYLSYGTVIFICGFRGIGAGKGTD